MTDHPQENMNDESCFITIHPTDVETQNHKAEPAGGAREQVLRVSVVHPEGNMNVFTKCDPSNRDVAV